VIHGREAPVVVVGGGMAGARAAEFVAVRGKLGGSVVLVGDEPERPYRRPLVSKECLSGEVSDAALYLRPAEFYEQKGIKLLLGRRAVAVDADNRELHLADGAVLGYRSLLLAPGAAPRRLPVPGADLPGVHYLRTLADARRLGGALGPGGKALIVGGGFIGLEVAAACRKLGVDVTVVEIAQRPLRHVLGEQVGALVQALHEREGVRFRTSNGITELCGRQHLSSVRLSSGETLDADVAVVGIGVVPAVTWLQDSGLAVRDGLLVDEQCRTSAAEVYAAGDAARWTHPYLGELRVEHEINAQNQAVAAARAMLGDPQPYTAVPYVWSDQYQHRIRYVGHARTFDDVVIEHDPELAWIVARYLEQGRLKAVLAVNRDDVVNAARRLLQRGTPVEPEELARVQQ
jgi:3-phenylpropionate/trans-cinnamate dioxygenase ferredoxin reductase subunit